MKHLNFLSKSGSQSRSHNIVTLCTTVGSPSAHRRGIMLKLISVLVLILTIGFGQMWGADEVYKTATFTGSSFSANSQAYTGNFNSTTNGFTVAITNANNNNKAWNYIKIGGKSGAYTGTITTSAAIDKAITKVDLTIDAMSYSSNVTSIKLYSSSNNSSWTEEGTFTKAVGTQSVTINSPTASKYYKIEVVCTKASGNGCIQLSEVKYYKAQAVPSYTIIAQSNNNTWGTVALSETTITATPADCYQVKSGTAGYTVTAGTASVSHTGTSNTMTVTPSTNCTIQVNFEKKIVNTYVDEIQGNDDIEDCGTHDAPSLDDKTPATTGTCAEQHYHFMGWVTAANKANPTDANIITAGTEMTANGTTYYAVWTKSSAGSCATVTFKTNNSDSSTDISSNFTAQVDASSGMSSYSGSKVYSGSYGLKVGTGSAVGTVTCTLSSAITTKTITVDAKKYGSNNTNISVKVNGSTNFGSAQAIPATGDVLTFSLAANADPIAVSSVTVSTASKQGYIKTITVGEAATYSDYITTCCTELGSINGSVSVTQTTAALEWADLDHVSSWTVQYKEHSAENWNTWNGAQETADSKRSVTITGLTCGTAYDFKIAATGESGYCDAEDVLKDQSTSKWNISYTLTNTVEKTAGPEAGANACGEISATFSKNALYSFPENITVTIGGEEATAGTDYLWDEDEGTLYIDAAHVTGNVAVTIAGVAPANPIVTPSPSALSFEQVKKGAAVPAAQDIAITGQNLTDDLTVTSSDPTLYAVSVKSGSLIPDGNKDASPVITVTPQAGITSTAGDKNATITISGGGLAADVVVNVTFNVQETYTVNWYVNGTKIDANSKTDVEGTAVTAPSDFSTFTDCSELHFVGWATSAIAVAGTTTEPELVTPITAIGTTATTNYYAVFAEGTPASEVELMNEDFANELSNDNSNAYGTTNGGSKPAGFTGALDKAYAGKNGTAKLGSGSAAGYITSKSLDLSEAFSVSIKVKRYNDTDGGNVEITIDGDNDTKQVISNDDINSSTFESFKLNFDAATSTSTIKIATSTKRAYIDDVVVSQASDPVWTKWYTTCPHVSRVTLSAAEVSNGSISFEQSGSAVTNVRTDGGADVDVDVVPDPATGYELTGVALSGTAASHASYDAGVITIDADAEGALTATATFSQKNYEVIVEEYPVIGATLTGATTTAHYNDEITISTNEPAGYKFSGWCMYEVTDIERETDIADQFFTGDYDEYEFATTAKFKMPNRSIVAEANFKKIYSVDEFMDTEFTKTNNKWYYVTGLVAEVPAELYSGTKMTYVISDDASKSGLYLTLYRGLGEDGENFSAVSDLAVGDKVVVYGQWSSSYKNMNEGNYILKDCLTKKALSALAIVGTASVTTYDVGDSFDKTGLSLSATYNTGYVQANYTGTTITSNYDAPTTFTAGVTSVTVSAEEGLISTSRDIEVTVSSAVLDHVELAAGVQTEFWAKEQYKEPLLDAYLTDEPATVLSNVTGVSNTTGLDMSVAGNKSVTVTYTRKPGQTDDVEYNFTVKPVVVNEANAHSVATARSIIDVDKTEGEDLDLELEGTKTYVTGVVTSVHQNTGLTGGNAQYNGTYNIVIKDNAEDDEFIEIFRCSFGSGVTSVQVGDIIKAYGNLYWYLSSSKYEINTGGEVVAVVRTPNFTIADVAEMEVNITADLAEADLTIERGGSEGAITFSCSDPAVTIENNKLHAAAEGNATVTATMEADGIYTAAETTFNVHVIAERTRYEITMDKNGGSGTDPVYDNQLADATVDLPATCPYSKANHAFAAWEVNETVSGDEVTITDGHFTMPAAAVTIKATWKEVATCHISFQVNGSEVATADAPETEAYSLAGISHPNVDGFTWVGWSTTKYDNETTTLPSTITSYTPAASEATKTLYGIYSRLDDSDPSTGKYVKVAENQTDWSGQYLIVYESGNVALDGSLSTIDAAGNSIALTIANSIVTATTTANKTLDGSSFTIAKSNEDYTIRAAGGYYIGHTGSSNTLNSHSTNSYAHEISISNGNVSLTCGSYILKYNSDGTGRFRYYSSGQKVIQLYKKNNGTTYYTSSPVEKVTITFNAKGGNGGCSTTTINKGSQLTICADVPTKSHSEFAGWNSDEEGNGDAYVAGTTYTFNASATIYAQWTDATPHAVTYVANGATGSVPTIEDQYAGDQFNIAAKGALEKDGFDFVGWTYNGTLYKAGVSFTMPAEAVEFVAQWKKQNITKMTQITSIDQLVSGMNIVLACKDPVLNNDTKPSALAGDLGSSKFLASETANITFSGNEVSYTNANVLELVVEQVEGGWKLRKDATNYLKETGVKNLAWGTASEATTWTITFSNGNVNITSNLGSMKYNAQDPRFTTYASGQKDIQLYGKATVVNSSTSISEIGYVDGDVIVLNNDATLTVDANIAPSTVIIPSGSTVTVNNNKTVNANTVIVENGGTLDIDDEGTVKTAETLIIHSTLGKGTGTNTSGNAPGNSGQIVNGNNITVNGDVYLELELTQDAKASAGWYAFSVPFPVDAMNGVYYGDTKLTNEVGYAIMSHYGELRAKDEYAWKKFRGIMQPGVFYVITVGNTDYKTLRFKKVKDEALVASTSVAVSPFPSQTGNNADGAWNGIGNPNLAISNLSTAVTLMQFYDHKTNTFIGRNHSVNLVVGSAFFIQYNATTSVSIPVGTTSNSGYLAPQREQNEAENTIYEVELTNVATGELEDNVFLTAREDAMNEYEIGHDVAKMSMGTAKCAQMWVPAYGTQLCAADFPLVNDKATYPLTINAPSAGTYSISMVANENADLYLTYEGAIIWNLSMGAYTIDLTKGVNTGYGLLLKAKMPQTPTGIENGGMLNGANGVQKVIIDENVFILRGGRMYDVTGKAVK